MDNLTLFVLKNDNVRISFDSIIGQIFSACSLICKGESTRSIGHFEDKIIASVLMSVGIVNIMCFKNDNIIKLGFVFFASNREKIFIDSLHSLGLI